MAEDSLLSVDFSSLKTSSSQDSIPQIIRDGLAFEKANYAHDPTSTDPFYNPPPEDSATAPPGTLLKTETSTDPSKYLLPPGTALSRILYQSATLNGTPVPVSAFILWPFTSSHQSSDGGCPIVAWAHGTSGITPDCAPSNIKNLWQHYVGPFQIAMQGYAVVATDYAGLGVKEIADGREIGHEYLAAPAHANDVVYSVQAARTAFPDLLSKDWVTVGHSQGGAAAWAVAERMVERPVEGFLGAVPISACTRVIDEDGDLAEVLLLAIAPSIKSMDPDFNIEEIITPEGLEALELIRKLDAGMATLAGILVGLGQSGKKFVKDGWRENEYVQRFQERTQNGRKPFAGPLLVIFGEADPRLSHELATKTVKDTERVFPEGSLEFVLLPGVTHTPATTAGQSIWMEWIGERFRGVKAKEGYQHRRVEPVRPAGEYAKEQNWYIAPATEFYHNP